MCCFSGPVKAVSNTRIFARFAKPGQQHLVYQMHVDAPAEVAMILPLPVPAGTPENALTFHNLKEYGAFFDDMNLAFPEKLTRYKAPPSLGVDSANAPQLKVEKVGNYVASFVPSLADFPRLDKQFRLPPATWDKLPLYKDWGFAVFQLEKGDGERHAMAFTFPTRERTLFFPTVHIHDGEVHEEEEFDHTLYAQTPEGLHVRDRGWEESPGLAGTSVKCGETKGIVDPDAHLLRRKILGKTKNEDVFVAVR
jgi:hypothetical protein